MKASVLGQAVVSDALDKTGRGYALLAASPAVAEDRAALERSPGISDYLQRAPAPADFWSFFPLPSGRWAFTHRYLRGTRRGVNRVVTHTLVVPETILSAIDWQPWLLWRCAIYRAVDSSSSEQDLDSLAEIAGDPGIRVMPDLEAILRTDARQENLALLNRWRQGLAAAWGPELLASHLSAVLGALERGRRVLLPQEPAFEQLLALSWSILPQKDRRLAPWTTHFAPRVEAHFLLANAVDLEAARDAHRDTAHWVLFTGRTPAAKPAVGSAAALLAAAALGEEARLAALLAEWERTPLHFLATAETPDSAPLRRWLQWLSEGANLRREGFEDPAALGDYCRESAWLTAEERLDLAAATALRVRHRLGSFLTAAGAVAPFVGQLAPTAIEASIGWVANVQEAPAWEWAVARLAVALCAWDREIAAGTPNRGVQAATAAVTGLRLGAVQALLRPDAPPGSDRRPARETARSLFVDLARAGALGYEQLQSLLAEDAADLAWLCDHLQGSPADCAIAAALLDAAAGLAEPSAELCATLTSHVVSLIALDPDAVDRLPAALPAAFRDLRRQPSQMADVLSRWSGAAYEAAVAELDRWFDAGLAREAVAAATEMAARLAAKGAALQQAPAMGGLVLHLLADQGLADSAFLTFAQTGAEALTSGPQHAAARFADLLGQRTLPQVAAEQCAGAVLASCEAVLREGSRGHDRCHAALLALLRRSLANDPPGALRLESSILALEIRHGLAAFVPALERLDELAASFDPSAAGQGNVSAGLAAAMATVAGATGNAGATLIEVVSSDCIAPTVQRGAAAALFFHVLASANAAVAGLLTILPGRPVAGPVLLAAAQWLGREVKDHAPEAAAFVLAALAAARPDAAAVTLRTALASNRRGMRAALSGLPKRTLVELGAALAQATAATRGGWRLESSARLRLDLPRRLRFWRNQP